MRSFVLSLVPFLVLAACEEQAEAPPKTPLVAVSASASSTAKAQEIAPQTPQSTKLPAAVLAPASIACALTTNEWSGGTIRLRLAPKDEPFATVNRPESVKVSLPVGKPDDAAYYELDLGSAIVRAVVSGDEVPLYPKAAVVLGGFVIPLGSTRLAWSSAAVDAVTFEVNPGAMVKSKGDLRTTKGCAYFSLTEGRFDPISATGSPAPAKAAILRPLKNSLAGSLDGAAIADLDVSDSAQKVGILAVSGTRSRIAWQTREHLLFGWINSTALVNTTEALSIGGTPPEPPKPPAKRATSVPTWERRTCTSEIPLVAELKGEIRTIGAIKPGKVFELGPARAGYRMVSLPDSDLVAASGAMFYAPRALAEACNSAPTPP